MKHIRNFRNFSVNEMQDWTTLPVDVHAGMGDLYGQVGREIKSALGSAYKKFITNLESLDLSKISKNAAQKMLDAAGDFFGRDPLTLTADDVKKELKMEFPELTKESFVDKWNQTDPMVTKFGDSERVGEPLENVKGGPVQKFLSILSTVFAMNVLGFGLPGSWLVGWVSGILINPLIGIFLSLAAIGIIVLIRKLHKFITGYE